MMMLQRRSDLCRVRTVKPSDRQSEGSRVLVSLSLSMPVIDAIVLKNLNMRLPPSGASDRLAGICKIHQSLQSSLDAILQSENGGHLIRKFREKYWPADITDIKVIDLILWQTRPRINEAHESK
jgi:hypothetical protein